MAAALNSLRTQVQQLRAHRGWEQLVDAYGGANDMILSGHLRCTADKNGLHPSAAHNNILNTLAFREENRLNRSDVARVIESARCRPYWPYAFTDSKTTDGSPVEYCRLSRLHVRAIMTTFEEEEVFHFFALWTEQTLRLLGESVRAGAPTKGSLHVYDCRGVNWSRLFADVRQHWSAVSRVFALGSTHWPAIASHYYVINAPYTATLLWKLLAPLCGDHVKEKVSFSRGMHPELMAALGGEAAAERMQQCSPHVATAA